MSVALATGVAMLHACVCMQVAVPLLLRLLPISLQARLPALPQENVARVQQMFAHGRRIVFEGKSKVRGAAAPSDVPCIISGTTAA